MHRKIVVCLGLLFLAFEGADAAETPKSEGSAKAPLTQGVPYFLKQSVFNIKVTRQLVKPCTVESVVVRQSVELTDSTGGDPGAYYTIGLDNYEKFFKSNNVSINLRADGTLETIKNVSTDTTGEFIASVVGTAIKLTATSAGIPLSLLKLQADAVESVCNKPTLAALALVDRSESLARQEAEQKAKLGSLDKDSSQGKAAATELSRTQAQIKEITEDVAAARQHLTRIDAYQFVPAVAAHSMALEPSRPTMEAWFQDTGLTARRNKERDSVVCLPAQDCTGWAAIPKPLMAYAGVAASLFSSAGDDGTATGQDPGGVVYRVPVTTRFEVCAEQPCIDSEGQPLARGGSRLLVDRRPVLQLGRKALVPYGIAGMFQTLTTEMQTHDNGSLKSITYTSNVRADKLAESLSKAADSYASITEAKQKNQVEQLKKQKEFVEAEKALAEAEAQRIDAVLKLQRKQQEFGGAGG